MSRASTAHANLCTGHAHEMKTDTKGLLLAGLELAAATWKEAVVAFDWDPQSVDTYVVHQVSKVHTRAVCDTLGLDIDRFPLIYPQFGNIGPAGVPTVLSKAVEDGTVTRRRPRHADGRRQRHQRRGRRDPLVTAPSPAAAARGLALRDAAGRGRRPHDGVRRRGQRPAGRARARQPDLVVLLPLAGRGAAAGRPAGRSRRTTSAWAARTSRPPRDYPLHARAAGSPTSASSSTASGLDGPLSLVVHDWGGAIALAWAVDHPDRRRPAGAAQHRRLPAAGRQDDAVDADGRPAARRRRAGGDAGSTPSASARWCSAPGGTGCRAEARAGLLAPYDSPGAPRRGARFVQDIPLRPTDPAHAGARPHRGAAAPARPTCRRWSAGGCATRCSTRPCSTTC